MYTGASQELHVITWTVLHNYIQVLGACYSDDKNTLSLGHFVKYWTRLSMDSNSHHLYNYILLYSTAKTKANTSSSE